MNCGRKKSIKEFEACGLKFQVGVESGSFLISLEGMNQCVLSGI
jgi:hypothetical protein